MKNQYMISFVDKEYPPSHSFVEGFLCSSIFKRNNIINIIIVTSKAKIHPKRYLNTILCSIYSGRKNLKRITNLFKTYFFLKSIIQKKNVKCIFIRNDINILIPALFFKNKIKIIFQQSFPFENDISINKIKRSIYRWTLKKLLKYVYLVVVISDLSKSRLKYANIHDDKFLVIPLLNSFSNNQIKINITKKEKIVKYVYIGSLSKLRKIDFWLDCFNCIKNTNFHITMYGTNIYDTKMVKELDSYKKLLNINKISIFNKIDRDILNDNLINFDVGISLIPPTEIYLESAPTKLTEYMNAGLALFANNEIKFQKDIIAQSNSGTLCAWKKQDIITSINYLCNMSNIELEKIKNNSYNFCKENLSYEKYVHLFIKKIKNN